MQLGEVGDILGHDGAALLSGKCQEIAIGDAVEVDARSRSDHVMTAGPKLASDFRGEVLVQQELHRKIVRSSSAAARSRSATASRRARTSSTSSGKAA